MGIASMLEAYRPAFIVLTFGFLAAAFYFTYRPRKGVTSSKECCATGSVCCPPTGTVRPRQFSVLAFNKVMLWSVTVLAVAFLFFPSYVGLLLAGRSDAGAVSQDDPLIRQTVIAVEGMHCEGCTVLVEKSIEDVPGVLDVTVDYEGKQAVVSTKACCPFPKVEVLGAMRQAGYSPTIIETE
jgi:copper chaperone CopZ